MSKNMNIKIDDNTYATFTAAAKIISDTGITIPVVQLAETIINAELAGMHPEKIARKFVRSLGNRVTGKSVESGFKNEEQAEGE
jgi:hypothetical protein